jgi:mannitol-specific phosphotransferase system IIBC component
MKQRILPLYVIPQNEYREEDIESIIHENSQYFDFSQSKKRSRQESNQKTKRQKTISSSHTRSYPNVKYRYFVIEDGEHIGKRIRLVFKYNGEKYILHQIRVKEQDIERIIIDPHDLDSIISTKEFINKMKGISDINHTISRSRGGRKRKSTYRKHINF